MISPYFERDLHRLIEAEARNFNCHVLALNGIETHVHTLLQMPATITIAEVVQKMKGESSRGVNARCALEFDFRWSSAYAAFSVSRWDKKQLITYIQNQKEHHASGTHKNALELPPEHELIPD